MVSTHAHLKPLCLNPNLVWMDCTPAGRTAEGGKALASHHRPAMLASKQEPVLEADDGPTPKRAKVDDGEAKVDHGEADVKTETVPLWELALVGMKGQLALIKAWLGQSAP